MLFKQGLKWLWYCNHPNTKGYSSIDTSLLLILDEVWHTFILYTKDYSQFCLEYFGRYIHHAPTTRQDLANNSLLPINLSKGQEKILLCKIN